MPALLTLGIFLIGLAAGFHVLVMLRIGEAHQVSLAELVLRGGSLDYRIYLAVRKKFAWSIWPVWLVCICLLSGLAVLVLGLAKG